MSKIGIIKINRVDIRIVKRHAVSAPLKRARICLHKDKNDPLQDMVIALCKDSYIAPHKHERKVESLHAIEGSFYLVTFDTSGRVIEKVLVNQKNPRGLLVCRIKKNIWHTVIPLSAFVVFHEIIRGPFQGETRKEIADWAPKKESEIKAFISALLKGTQPVLRRGQRKQ